MRKTAIFLMLLMVTFSSGICLAGEKCEKCMEKSRVKLYGYVKLDASYDSRQISVGNFARWVENYTSENGYLNITARQTRLGLSIAGPESDEVITTGKLEIDFYGGGAENKNIPMLRHAFVKIFWKRLGFSLLAGQTWDVLSPLVPGTVNYPVLWWCGNIGYRRPQIRLSKILRFGDLVFNMDFAGARAIGAESEGEPVLQYRFGTDLKGIKIGFSGHNGKESPMKKTSSYGIDVTLPLPGKVAIKGEFWTGKNLAGYLGGIGQSGGTDIRSKGGWFALSMGPYASIKLNMGYGFDDPDDDDVTDAGGTRLLNKAVFMNMFYSINRATSLAFEVSRWETEYPGGMKEAFRAHFSVIYKL